MKMNTIYVNNNGVIIPSKGASIASGNRSYLYGDGLFETVRIIDGKVINTEHHFNRLIQGVKALKMNIPFHFTIDFMIEKIEEITRLSGITEGGKCRVSIDRSIGGTYFPETNETTYFIEVFPYDSNHFELNSKGIEIDIYYDIKKQKNFLSNFKTKNGLLYVMAAITAKENQKDDLLILNEKGAVIESSNSNLFVVSNGVLYTPSLEEGCLGGTMRMQIINIAIQHGIKVYECSILPQNLLAADEVFLTNSVRGITWVGGYKTKRYFNIISRKLVSFLNIYWEKQLRRNDDD